METLTIAPPHERVQPATDPLDCKNTKDAIESLINSSVNACSDYSSDVVQVYGRTNQFFGAIQHAYNAHYPIVLSPDMFWLCIAQGIAQHINLNAEELRSHFVEHEGKKELAVYRNHGKSYLDSLEYPWPDMFAEFNQQIAEHIGEKHELLSCNFSTTGPIEKAASDVVLMDAMQSYFEYTCYLCCYIPEVILEGEVKDWERIQNKVEQASEFLPDWWVKELRYITEELTRAAQGDFNEDFWRGIVEIHGGSGPPSVSGWATMLFPYDKEGNRNPVFRDRQNDDRSLLGRFFDKIGRKEEAWWPTGIDPTDLPLGLAKAPVKVVDNAGEYEYEFLAGFMGYTQDEDLKLRPKIGWAVREKIPA